MDSDYKITMEQAETEMACYRKIFSEVRLLDKEALESLKKERESTSDNIGNDVQQLGPSVQRMRSNGCTDGKERIIQAGIHWR